jgi:hypothetical protein
VFTTPAPTVAIVSPVNGARYTQRRLIDAAYACTPAVAATISSCAGPVASGAAIDTSTLGSHTFTVDATDGFGDSTSRSVTYSVVSTVAKTPSLTRFKQSHSSWREGNAMASISERSRSKHGRPPIGTTFSFTLSESATVKLTFTEHQKCPAHSRRKCKRSTAGGTLSKQAPAGQDKISFQGRVSSRRKLAFGSYTVTIAAVGAKPSSLRFTIVH